MTPRELERLEKDSIYSLHINDDLKDSVIKEYLNELTRIVKKEIKNKGLVLIVTKDQSLN